jgi:hypothetical protein
MMAGVSLASDVERALKALDRTHPPLDNVLAVRAQLELALHRLSRAADANTVASQWLLVRDSLVTVIALAQRAVRDCGLESTADAIGKEIRF